MKGLCDETKKPWTLFVHGFADPGALPGTYATRFAPNFFDAVEYFTAWRRNRDSNPSALLQAYELSKPAPSTTWVFLHIDLRQARL